MVLWVVKLFNFFFEGIVVVFLLIFVKIIVCINLGIVNLIFNLVVVFWNVLILGIILKLIFVLVKSCICL